MASTISAGAGRLGNQIIRNLAVSFIAEKFNLKVYYGDADLIHKLGIDLFSGIKTYKKVIRLNDSNYFAVLNSGNINYNLNPNYDFFQTRAITNLIYNYLQSDTVKSHIIEKNNFRDRYNNNNDLFVHIRLGDVTHLSPTLKYYTNVIKKIHFDNLYISTDSKDNDLISKLFEMYPTTKVIDYDEIESIQFGSTCKHILLSHGTFSAVIGYLGFFSTVYYPQPPKKPWHGDIFSIRNWIQCTY